MKHQTYHFALAGSTNHAATCAQALNTASNFQLSWILTPQPKPVGRNQKIAPNSVQKQFEQIPTALISSKIDQSIKKKIRQLNKKQPVDFLLVVDFGYILPSWLLNLPKQAAVNVHPSLLPRWRGASPGQFVLLAGETTSGVSLFQLNQTLDQGPVIYQHKFEVQPSWSQQDYYQHSFKAIAPQLALALTQLSQGKIKPEPQPKNSPTPIARQLNKNDAYLPWQLAKLLMGLSENQTALKKELENLPQNSILKYFLDQTTPSRWPQVIERASRALAGWPILWTKIPTTKGEKRMQIISCRVSSTTNLTKKPINNQSTPDKNQILKLERVKIAGQQIALWNQVKNVVI